MLTFLEMCSPGNYSATGLVPCSPCPLLTYTMSKGSVSCTPCDETAAVQDIPECYFPEISTMQPSSSLLPMKSKYYITLGNCSRIFDQVTFLKNHNQ